MTKITRIEVIDRTNTVEEGGGRMYLNYDVKDAWIDLQDNGATLKVFINEKPPKQWLITKFETEHLPASQEHLQQILTSHFTPKGVKIIDSVVVI